jgi:hypothetical protein
MLKEPDIKQESERVRELLVYYDLNLTEIA